MLINVVYDHFSNDPDFPTEQLCTFKINTDELVCALTKQPLKDPVVASDGYTYERQAIIDWFNQQQDHNFTKSPIENCKNILEVDNEQNLILRSNLLIKNLIEAKDSNLDIEQSGLIDHITLNNLIRNPIICADGNTYDLYSEMHWLQTSPGFTTSVSRFEHSYATFPNLLVEKLLKDFHQEYNGLHRVSNRLARDFFNVVKNQSQEHAIAFLREKPELIDAAINDDNAQIIHLLAAHNKLEVIDFLVNKMRVRLDTLEKNGHIALFYACKGQGLDFIKFWQANKQSLNHRNGQIDALVFAITLNRPDVIQGLFDNGFKIDHIDAQYLMTLINLLSFKSFAIIELVIKQLKAQNVFTRVQGYFLPFIGNLAQNKLLAMENFLLLFNDFDLVLRQRMCFGPNGEHPYILGAINRNIPYLKAFNQYCQNTRQTQLINLVSQPGTDEQTGRPKALPATALQLATFSKLSRVIVTLLSFGANPSMQNNEIYSFDIALVTLLACKTQWELIPPKIILNYLLTQKCANLHPKHMQDIMSHFNPEDLNALLSQNKFSLIKQMLVLNNQRLLSAYQQLARANNGTINVYRADLSQRKFNFLHAICTDDNEYVVTHCLRTANVYYDLLAQRDENGQTPFELALSAGKSPKVIQEFIKIIKQLLITPKFKDFDYEKILEQKLLEKNPNFTLLQRAQLYACMAENFAPKATETPKNLM